MSIGIIFDLDGTLLDTLDDLWDATNYALTQYGCPPRTRDEVRRFVGNGAETLIRLSLPLLPTKITEISLRDCFFCPLRLSCLQRKSPPGRLRRTI